MIIEIEKFLQENINVKKIIVNQTWGLGDILFIEPLYRYLDSLGLKVIAPVQDGYIWLNQHIKYVDFIKSSEFNIDYERFDFGLSVVDGVEIILSATFLALPGSCFTCLRRVLVPSIAGLRS